MKEIQSTNDNHETNDDQEMNETQSLIPAQKMKELQQMTKVQLIDEIQKLTEKLSKKKSKSGMLRREEVLELLKVGPLTIKEIATSLDIEVKNVSSQLFYLRNPKSDSDEIAHTIHRNKKDQMCWINPEAPAEEIVKIMMS